MTFTTFKSSISSTASHHIATITWFMRIMLQIHTRLRMWQRPWCTLHLHIGTFHFKKRCILHALLRTLIQRYNYQSQKHVNREFIPPFSHQVQTVNPTPWITYIYFIGLIKIINQEAQVVSSLLRSSNLIIYSFSLFPCPLLLRPWSSHYISNLGLTFSVHARFSFTMDTRLNTMPTAQQYNGKLFLHEKVGRLSNTTIQVRRPSHPSLLGFFNFFNTVWLVTRIYVS